MAWLLSFLGLAFFILALQYRNAPRGARLVRSTDIRSTGQSVFDVLNRMDRLPQWHWSTTRLPRGLRPLRFSAWAEHVPSGVRINGPAKGPAVRVVCLPPREIRYYFACSGTIAVDLAFRLAPRPDGCRLTCQVEYRLLGWTAPLLNQTRLRSTTDAALERSLDHIRRFAEEFSPTGIQEKPPGDERIENTAPSWGTRASRAS